MGKTLLCADVPSPESRDRDPDLRWLSGSPVRPVRPYETHSTYRLQPVPGHGGESSMTIGAALTSDHDASTAVQSSVSLSESNPAMSDGKDELKALEEGGAVPAPTSTLPPGFVEGGLRGYLNVFGAWLTLIITFGYNAGFGAFQDYYKANKYSHKSSSDIAWVGSIQLWCLFTMSIISGTLYDKVTSLEPKGYFRYTIGGGSVLLVFCLFMVSLCKEFWQTILAQGFGMGIAMGFMFLSSISVLSQNWKRRRAFAMGFAVTGSSIGGVIFPIMINRLLAKKPFGEARRVTAYLVLGCAVVINLLMRASPPPPKPPGAANVQPLKFFREPPFILAATGAFFVAMGLFIALFFIQFFLTIKRVDPTITTYSLAILNAASVFGRTIPNAIADRIGPFKVLLPTVTLSGACVFIMFAANSSAGATVFALLYGFLSGAYVSLVGPVFVSTVRMGLPFVFIGAAALIGSPIAGQLLIRTPITFAAPIVFAGCSMLLGACFLYFSWRAQAQVKGTSRI
ncbi:BQ2448_1899 [Microbotryum intermedium]|uniref:BQ2448_1899 protein n=1 Tax=Microbotryum intermedium TaxID=269621 RepID=A0A238FBD6_9BASI|nr:BQ2448_1899 [Microbotryum intermedium]